MHVSGLPSFRRLNPAAAVSEEVPHHASEVDKREGRGSECLLFANDSRVIFKAGSSGAYIKLHLPL